MDLGAVPSPEVAELYRQYRTRALAIARRIVKDADEAEDVVQDVFVRLCVNGLAFDGKSATTTWLHRVMVNSSINQLRGNGRRARLTTEPEPLLSPEQAAIGRELHARFVEALEHVSARHRDVLALRELRGLSYPEIAALLHIPEGTVKSTLNRAREKIQDVLAEPEEAAA